MLKCPKCGNTEPQNFRYLEDIECWRQVSHTDKLSDEKQYIFIDGFYQTGEGYDEGKNPRLECHACPNGNFCGAELPMPDDVEIEWV